MRCGTPDRVPVGSFTLGHLDPESEFGREFIRRTDSITSPGCGFDALGAGTPREHTDEGGGVTVARVRGPKGDLVWRWRRTSITTACIEFPCKTAADIEKVLALPYAPPTPDLSSAAWWAERFGDDILVMPGLPNAVCCVADLFSPEHFCLLWADDPAAMAELCRVFADRLVEFVRKVPPGMADAFRLVGGEYVTTQLGPAGVGPLLGDCDPQLHQAIHQAGALAYYHCHGAIMRYLGDLADLGMDAMDPFEAPPWGDCDLAHTKQSLRGRVCIVGNLDDMEVLERRDADTVRRIGRERIRQAGPDGFVLGGTASGTFTEKGARGFYALLEVAEEYAAAR
jgi:hypothetical protein